MGPVGSPTPCSPRAGPGRAPYGAPWGDEHDLGFYPEFERRRIAFRHRVSETNWWLRLIGLKISVLSAQDYLVKCPNCDGTGRRGRKKLHGIKCKRCWGRREVFAKGETRVVWSFAWK